ncbi:MAG: acyltransferase domain-containing protein [Aquabacterium sp.]|nr:acyltransferase domain-containing protein [Aquabacterium sp.]
MNQTNAPIAIIGMACLFPQAPDLHAFWRNIVNGVDAIGTPVPGWDAERYLATGRIKTSAGGYLGDLYRFNPTEFGIMPNSLDGGEPDQYLALRVARDALRDAGYLRDDADHRDTGIILGHSTYLHRGQGTIVQHLVVVDQTIELLRVACPHLTEDQADAVRAMLRARLPQSNADVAPGLVPNVMTGRIANRLNLRGPNYLVDAACSSSLLAVGAAIDELRAGRSRMMLAGGVNASLPAEVCYIFTQLGALSGRGKVRPFEAGSDGTLLGEGLGVVALKRLEDALADGDRVYAVVRGVGQASDGRGHGLLAPSIEGEALAIRRAWQAAGLDPASLSLVECHGTGIPLGDQTEVAALKSVLGERQGEQGTVAIGSVKSMISHCIPAAGVAGLIKTALALHHRVLPPTLCEEPNPALGLAQTPLYLNNQVGPWIHPTDAPRRAGVNSFGFGGINAHCIVEQAPPQAARHPSAMPWPAELCVLAADSAAELAQRAQALVPSLEAGHWSLPEVAAALAGQATNGNHRLAVVARSTDALAAALTQAARRLAEDDAPAWQTRGGITYSRQRREGRLAFLFPGEGSQYMGMFADLAQCFEPVREWLDFWRGLYPAEPGAARTDIVYPPHLETTAARRKQLESRLHDMDVGSEAVFVGGQAMHALLLSLGVQPDVMVGHSSGESAALAASGVVAASERAELAEFIRQLNAVYERVLAEGKIAVGALLAVGALPAADVLAHVERAGGEVVVAMDNCANQLVLYGSNGAIESIQKALATEGAICLPLPFDRGYHTPAFQAVSEAFLKYYKGIRIARSQVPLYSCASAAPFPAQVAGIRQLAAAQWSQTVRFRETILRMHDDGVRVFLEVGPSNNLTAFVGDILVERDYLALASNQRRRNGVEHLLGTLGQLYVGGQPFEPQRLFDGRAIRTIDLAAAPQSARAGLLLDNTMPQIRLAEADRSRMAALMGTGSTEPPAGTASASAQAPAVGTAGAEQGEAGRGSVDAMPVLPHAATESPVLAGDDARQAVMAGYFGLMRQFLDQQHAVMTNLPALDVSRTEPDGFALLSNVIELDEMHVVAECALDVGHHAFLRDHVLSGAVSEADPGLTGLACVPLMVSLEVMAEAAAVLRGALPCVIEQVKAYDWIALDEGSARLLVRVERAGEGCRAVLERDGRPVVSADFGFAADWRLPEVAPPEHPQPSRWNDGELYATGMFHGPLFQSISHIDGYDSSGIGARLSELSLQGFTVPGQAGRFALNPVLLDAVGQLAAYWIAQYAGYDFNSFPSTIERIELRETCPADVPGVRLVGRQQPVDPQSTEVGAARRWDFDAVDGEGRSLLRVGGLVNVFFAVPNRYYQLRRDPLNGALGVERAGAPGVLLWELPMLDDAFCTQSSGIFLRILAHAVLSAGEREQWRSLDGSPGWRRQWLLGRACLKEAVRHWLAREAGVLVHLADIVVTRESGGAPCVDGLWCADLPVPAVSLSHNGRSCIAAVVAPGYRVGVDQEDLARPLQPQRLLGALAATEQDALAGLADAALRERLLRLWCAKEAAAKSTGVGLQGDPQAWVVRFLDDNCNIAMVEYDGLMIEVGLQVIPEHSVMALAVCEDVAAEVLP